MAQYLDYERLQRFWNKVKGIIAIIQNDVSNLSTTKQNTSDDTLATTDKTIVGAINEVKALAEAGGGGGVTSDTFTDITISGETGTYVLHLVGEVLIPDFSAEIADDGTIIIESGAEIAEGGIIILSGGGELADDGTILLS